MAQSNMNFLPNEVLVYTEQSSLFKSLTGRQETVSESLSSNADKVVFNLVRLDQEDRRDYY